MTTLETPAVDAPLSEKVAFGAQELDRLTPDWYLRVSPLKLDLSHDSRCVLGFLHEFYDDGLEVYDWNNHEAEERGMYYDADDRQDMDQCDRAYEELTELWVQEITGRLLNNDEEQ